MGGGDFCGLPLVPFESLENVFPKEEYKILLGIGYSNMNNIRKNKFYEIKEIGYEIISYISSKAVIQSNNIGNANIILENTIIQPFVDIGDANIFWSNCNICHHSYIGNFNFFAPSVSLSGNIKMGNNCFIGNNSTIKNKVSVNSYSLIGAGSYVSQDVSEYSVIVPYKSIKLENKRSINFI